METIISETKCVQCGYERAYIEVSTTTVIYEVKCSRCGYMEECRPLIDRKCKYHFLYKRRKDGELIYRRYPSVGFGAFAIKRNGFGNWSKFNHQMSAEELQQFVERLISNIDPDTIFYVTNWNEKTNSIDVVAGKFFGEGEGG